MTRNLHRQSQSKYLEQSKKIQYIWTRLENVDTCFCVPFDCCCQSLVSGKETGH